MPFSFAPGSHSSGPTFPLHTSFFIFLPSFFLLLRYCLVTIPGPQGGQRAGLVWPQVNGLPQLLTSLLSHRPRAGFERPEHPAEAASARAQRPALARTPRSSAAAHGRSARALGAAARARAALAHPAAAAEAEPDQPHSETARPGPRGDSAGARIQVMHPVPGVLTSLTEPGGGCSLPGLLLLLSMAEGKAQG